MMVRSIGIHDPSFHAVRPYQVLAQEILVVGKCRNGGVPCAVHDLLAVRREKRSAVVARSGDQAAYVRSVGLHRVDVEIIVVERREDDGPPSGDTGLSAA
jgi:hypothetical protein